MIINLNCYYKEFDNYFQLSLAVEYIYYIKITPLEIDFLVNTGINFDFYFKEIK